MKNIFNEDVAQQIVARIENLSAVSIPIWGTMSASQMLAHCCVAYEMVYSEGYPRPNRFTRWVLKTFVKKMVISEKPYPKNGKTARPFLIKDDRNFEHEKGRLIAFINQTQQLGKAEFEGKASPSFGNLTAAEWSCLFYKHLDHHLTQFGV